jgi:hypothetical protein
MAKRPVEERPKKKLLKSWEEKIGSVKKKETAKSKNALTVSSNKQNIEKRVNVLPERQNGREVI